MTGKGIDGIFSFERAGYTVGFLTDIWEIERERRMDAAICHLTFQLRQHNIRMSEVWGGRRISCIGCDMRLQGYDM